MDSTQIQPLLDDLDDTLTDLESALAPILQSSTSSSNNSTTGTITALSATASKLPLLDKAKLYVLATYTIESLLFSYLRVSGVDAKSHPVFRELARVREYFAKITAAEGAGAPPSAAVDKQAAARFVKHGLAGNDRYDREREAVRARERAGAKRKLDALEQRVGTHTRFDASAKRARTDEERVGIVKAEDAEDEDEEAEEGEADDGEMELELELEQNQVSAAPHTSGSRKASGESKKPSKAHRRQQRRDAAAQNGQKNSSNKASGSKKDKK